MPFCDVYKYKGVEKSNEKRKDEHVFENCVIRLSLQLSCIVVCFCTCEFRISRRTFPRAKTRWCIGSISIAKLTACISRVYWAALMHLQLLIFVLVERHFFSFLHWYIIEVFLPIRIEELFKLDCYWTKLLIHNPRKSLIKLSGRKNILVL